MPARHRIRIVIDVVGEKSDVFHAEKYWHEAITAWASAPRQAQAFKLIEHSTDHESARERRSVLVLPGDDGTPIVCRYPADWDDGRAAASAQRALRVVKDSKRDWDYEDVVDALERHGFMVPHTVEGPTWDEE